MSAILYLSEEWNISNVVFEFLLHILHLDGDVTRKDISCIDTCLAGNKPIENVSDRPIAGQSSITNENRFQITHSKPGIGSVSGSIQEQCLPPFLIKSQEPDFPRIIYAGLCTVARQIVKMADEKDSSMNCHSLLGYKETCLKSHAEASRWTKFCEVDLPNGISQFCNCLIQRSDMKSLNVPNALLQLEKELRTPKRLPNASKYFGPGRKKWEKQLRGKSFNGIHTLDIVKNTLKRKRESNDDCQERITSNANTVMEGNISNEFTADTSGLSPYLCDFYLTLADIVVFVHVHHLLSLLSSSGHSFALSKELPLLFLWFNRLQERTDFLLAMKKTLMQVLDIATQVFNLKVMDVLLPPDAAVTPVSKSESKQRNRGSFQGIETKLTQLIKKLEGNESLMQLFTPSRKEGCTVDWEKIPKDIDPSEGELNPKRAERKRHQIENILHAVKLITKAGNIIVDFCAGGGHVGIVLAYFLPECQLILVENKEDSIARAVTRIGRLKLKNILICQSNMEYFNGKFDVGVALHACGLATDLVLKSCLSKRASFVVCPCCYGSVKCTNEITYPRSRHFMTNKVDNDDYAVLAHGSDMVTWDFNSDKSQMGQYCMKLIDNDRCAYMSENGYLAGFSVMVPGDCTPKNHLLAGTAVPS